MRCGTRKTLTQKPHIVLAERAADAGWTHKKWQSFLGFSRTNQSNFISRVEVAKNWSNRNFSPVFDDRG